MTPAATLQAAPAPIGPIDLLPEQLPAAWQGGAANALAIASALSQKSGRNLPWTAVRDAIDGAVRARILEMARGSGPWPCDLPAAATVTLVQPASPPIPPPVPPGKPQTRIGQAELQPAQIQDLADVMGDLLRAKGGLELTFHVQVEVTGKELPNEAAIEAINAVLRTVSPDIEVK